MCPTEPLCCETQLCASIFERCSGPTPCPTRIDFPTVQSFSTPKVNADPTRTSPIIHGPRHSRPNFVSNFLRQQWQAHLPPANPHEPRSSDFITHPSFIRPHAGCEGEAQNLGLPRTNLVDHGSTPRPFDAAVQYCTVHMTVDAFALARHSDSLGAVDVFVTPPTSQGLAHTALDTLEPLPIAMKTVSKYIGHSPLPTRSVIMSSCLYVLVHHSDSGLGSMSRSNSSSMMSFTMQVNLSLLSLNSQQSSVHIIPRNVCSLSCCPPKDNPLPKHVFGNAPPQHRGLHTSSANAPRVPKVSLAVLKARGPQDVLHLCQQSRRQMSMYTCRSEYLGYYKGFCHIEGRFHVQASHKSRVISKEPRLQINASVFLPLPVSLEYVRDLGLHVFTIHSPFGSNMHAFPFRRSCSMSTKTVAYHLENTLDSAIARNPRRPFSSLPFFLKKKKTQGVELFTPPGHDTLLGNACQTSAPSRTRSLSGDIAAFPSPSNRLDHWLSAGAFSHAPARPSPP